MNKIRKGDDVVVIAGKDKGKRGTVLRVLAEGKVVVEGINLAKKHQRPNPGKNIAGGIIEKTMPIAISNIALFNTATNKADRVGIRLLEDGKKVGIFKSTGEVVSHKG